MLAIEEDPKEVFFALAREDIRGACDLLRPVFERGEPRATAGSRSKSTPTSPTTPPRRSARPGGCTTMVDRANLFVKIPGTKAGLSAIEETIAAGIPVNVTLLFSLERHRAAAEAYVRGLRRLRDDGGDCGTVASVASFFVSRVDTEADRRLEEIGGHDELQGKLAIANAKLAYQTYKEIFSGPDWKELKSAGASAQRCLWASTSTKNPDYRDVHLRRGAGRPETVNTMPRETIEAYSITARSSDTLEKDVDEARRTLEASRRPGSTTTTWWPCSSARAWRSSPSPSRS